MLVCITKKITLCYRKKVSVHQYLWGKLSGPWPVFCLVHVFHHPSCCFSFIHAASAICIWNKITSSYKPLNHLTVDFILRRDAVVLHGWREVLNCTKSLKGLVDMTVWIQPWMWVKLSCQCSYSWMASANGWTFQLLLSLPANPQYNHFFYITK